MQWLSALDQPQAQVVLASQRQRLCPGSGRSIALGTLLWWCHKRWPQPPALPKDCVLIDATAISPIRFRSSRLVFVSPVDGRELELPIVAWEQIVSALPWLMSEEQCTRFASWVARESAYLISDDDPHWAVCQARGQHLLIGPGCWSDLLQLTTTCDKGDRVLSSLPLSLASSGAAVVGHRTLRIDCPSLQHWHCPLLPDCPCDTCENHTGAYLYHLHQHCRSLAVQLVAVHNLYWWGQWLRRCQ